MQTHDTFDHYHPIENSLCLADIRHPSEIIEPLPVEDSARDQASMALSKVFVWAASGTGFRQYAIRAMVILHTIRKDLISGKTLEEIGEDCGCSKQQVEKLIKDFRQSTGL